IYVLLEGIIDFNKELARLNKISGKLETDIKNLNRRLEDPEFIERAPAEEVEKMKYYKKENELKISRIRNYIEALK
ncbi:MAG: hypothetical protein AB1633_03690, partial [Elusimicrobiota bacterium]